MTYTTWRRQLAYSESLALRALVRAHGRLPTFAPTVVTWDMWTGTQGGRHSTPITCGTNSGYRKHKREGEDACDECKAAHNRAEQERRSRAA